MLFFMMIETLHSSLRSSPNPFRDSLRSSHLQLVAKLLALPHLALLCPSNGSQYKGSILSGFSGSFVYGQAWSRAITKRRIGTQRTAAAEGKPE